MVWVLNVVAHARNCFAAMALGQGCANSFGEVAVFRLEGGEDGVPIARLLKAVHGVAEDVEATLEV